MQWFPNWGTRTPRGTKQNIEGYAKKWMVEKGVNVNSFECKYIRKGLFTLIFHCFLILLLGYLFKLQYINLK